MIAPVPQNVHYAHDPPALKFAQASAHIGTRHCQGRRYFIGWHRPRREEQQGVHLRHRAVDSPARAHLSPMQNEFLCAGRYGVLCHFHPVTHFCTYRTYSTSSRLSSLFFLPTTEL